MASLTLAMTAFTEVTRTAGTVGHIGGSSILTARPAFQAQVSPGAAIAGSVTDSDEDGLGDDSDDLPGLGPVLIAAGVGPQPSGSVTDPPGDSDTDPMDPMQTGPDLVSATVGSDGTNLNLSVRFASGTFDAETQMAQFILDTDQDRSTGNPTVDLACIGDIGNMGADFIVTLGGSLGSEAIVGKFEEPCPAPAFGEVGRPRTVTIVTDGLDATVPLSLIDNDDGSLDFKVVAISPGLLIDEVTDVMPDLGMPPGESRGGLQVVTRIQIEWDITTLQSVIRQVGSASVVLTTEKGAQEDLETFFFAGSGDQDGVLSVSDFQSPTEPEPIPGFVLPVLETPPGTEEIFSFDVTAELRAALEQGFDFFSIQGRVDEGMAGSGFRKGLQIHSTATESLELGKEPRLEVSFRSEANLAILKDDGRTLAIPGGTLNYTITVTNNGPDDVSGATVTDVFPPQLGDVSWFCSPSEGSSCATVPGTGDIRDIVEILADGVLSYMATATVDADARGVLVNTASVAIPMGVDDPDLIDNSFTDTSFIAPFLVNSTLDEPDAFPGNGICDTGRLTVEGRAECTLRAAVQESNALSLPEDQRNQMKILLPTGLYPLSMGNLRISDHLVIEGEFEVGGVVCGSGEFVRGAVIDSGGQDRVFHIAQGVDAQLFRVTIRNGDSGLSGLGGGVLNFGVLTLAESTLSGNRTFDGGGIANFGELTLRNVTVSGNRAFGNGGGIFNQPEASLTLESSTVFENTAPMGDGGGIAGSAVITNSIIANNPGGDCSGETTSQGGSLDSDGSCGLGAGDLPNTVPLLGPLQDNDGPSPTHALMPGSPAIDAGNSDACPATDQRGAGRPIDGNDDGQALCDIGAYEAPPLQPDTASRDVPAAADFDNALKAFVMIGNPLSQPPDPPGIFIDAFGPALPDLWRLFRWGSQQGDFEIISQQDFDFSPGPGFWLITRDGGRLTITADPNDASGAPINVVLQPGFQQIATPFNFPIRWWGCIACPEMPEGALQAPACLSRLPEGVSPCLWGFDGTGAEDPNDEDAPAESRGYFINQVMQPLFGYFVYNGSDSAVTLSIPPICAETGALAQAGEFPRPDSPSTPEGWRAHISAAVGDLRDSDNYLGEDIAGQDGPDPLDFPEPPPLLGLSLYFPHPEWEGARPLFATDIRALPHRSIAFKEAWKGSAGRGDPARQVWEFEVWTHVPRAQVELRWRLERAEAKSLTLWDLDGQRTLNMSRIDVYTYESGPGGIRRFRVTAR